VRLFVKAKHSEKNFLTYPKNCVTIFVRLLTPRALLSDRPCTMSGVSVSFSENQSHDQFFYPPPMLRTG
jgi:hypothetical protein